jgi:lysophospholipase L1-like esterase
MSDPPSHLTTPSGVSHGSVSRRTTHAFEMECREGGGGGDVPSTERTRREASHFGNSISTTTVNDAEENELEALVANGGRSTTFEAAQRQLAGAAAADSDDASASVSSPSLTLHLSHHRNWSFRAQLIAGVVGIFFILIVSSQMGRYPLNEDDSDGMSLPYEESVSSCRRSDAEDIGALLAKVKAQSPRDRCHHDDNDDNDDDSSDISSQVATQQPCHCSNPLEPANFTDRPEWNRGYLRNVELAREAVASSRDLDVVLLGDSIVEFWQATYKGAPIAMFESNHEVYQRLFDSPDAPIQGLALGVAGDKCNQLLYRIQNGIIEGLHPKVFWVLIGTNDVLASRCRADQVVAGNVAIIRELQRQRPNTTIVVQALLPVGDSAGIVSPNLYATINRRLACVTRNNNNANGAASAGAPVQFVNATELFLTSSNAVNETLLPDKLHPSAAGAEVWGQAIVSTVLRILQQ